METIDAFLREYGLKPLITEPCLFVQRANNKITLVVLLNVDDILYCGNPSAITALEAAIASKFQLKSSTKSYLLLRY